MTFAKPPGHKNCRCVLLNEWPQRQPPRTEMNDLGSKLAALILLSDKVSKRVIVPSREEWIGLNLLDRDGEL